MQIRVADYIAKFCADAGLRDVFMVTGGGAMHLNDAFGRCHALEVTCFHHEQAAAMAAESYFRCSNKLCVLNVTTGPGGINALNGVYGAYVDSIGMLIFSGQVKRETIAKNHSVALRQLGDQEVDIVNMVKPVAKYATVLDKPENVRQVLEKAMYLATCGRPGPVWIDVPVDIQGAIINTDILLGYSPQELLQSMRADSDVTPNTLLELNEVVNSAIQENITKIVSRIRDSKRPVLFAGAGVRLAGMHKEFLKLVDRLQIPVVTGWNAHDTLTNDHPCYAGRPGTVGDRAGNFTVQNSDLLIILGSRLNIRQVSYNWQSFAKSAWKVMVDIDVAELSKPTLKIDHPIHADLREFIPAFVKAVSDHQVLPTHTDYLRWCRDRVARYPVVLSEYYTKKTPINPYVVVRELFDELNENDIVVTANGTACVVGFQAAVLKAGQRLYTNSGSASMGYELPAAIGAYLASHSARIICLAGDGSIMMNLQELQTISGLKLPIKIIVLNNNGYQSIRQTQQAYFQDNEVGVGPDSGVTLPDFISVANAFRIPARSCNHIHDIKSELRWLLEISGPALLEVILDIDQMFSPKLASRKLPDGRMVSPSLEDMAPFLSREELAANTWNSEQK